MQNTPKLETEIQAFETWQKETAGDYITQFANARNTPDKWHLAYYDDELAGETPETRQIKEQTQALNRAIFQAKYYGGFKA